MLTTGFLNLGSVDTGVLQDVTRVPKVIVFDKMNILDIVISIDLTIISRVPSG